jgi:hypothetical protein
VKQRHQQQTDREGWSDTSSCGSNATVMNRSCAGRTVAASTAVCKETPRRAGATCQAQGGVVAELRGAGVQDACGCGTLLMRANQTHGSIRHYLAGRPATSQRSPQASLARGGLLDGHPLGRRRLGAALENAPHHGRGTLLW